MYYWHKWFCVDLHLHRESLHVFSGKWEDKIVRNNLIESFHREGNIDIDMHYYANNGEEYISNNQGELKREISGKRVSKRQN